MKIFFIVLGVGILITTSTLQAAQVTTHHCTVMETDDLRPNLSPDSPVVGVVYGGVTEYYGSEFNVYADRWGGFALHRGCPPNTVNIPVGNYSMQSAIGAWSRWDGGHGNKLDIRMLKCWQGWHWTTAVPINFCVSPNGAISPGN